MTAADSTTAWRVPPALNIRVDERDAFLSLLATQRRPSMCSLRGRMQVATAILMALGAMLAAAHAALVVDAEAYNDGAGSDVYYPASTSDLVNAGQPTLLSATPNNFLPVAQIALPESCAPSGPYGASRTIIREAYCVTQDACKCRRKAGAVGTGPMAVQVGEPDGECPALLNQESRPQRVGRGGVRQ